MPNVELLLPDPVWNAVACVFQSRQSAKGRPRLRERRVLSGILFVKYTATPWKELPRAFGFGAGNTCRRRYMEWLGDGTWARIYEAFHTLVCGRDAAHMAGAIEEWLRTLEDRRDETAAAVASPVRQPEAPAALHGRELRLGRAPLRQIAREPVRITRLLRAIGEDLDFV